MDFFKNCHTVEEIKAEYKRLARLHHPDLGGDQRETTRSFNVHNHLKTRPGRLVNFAKSASSIYAL